MLLVLSYLTKASVLKYNKHNEYSSYEWGFQVEDDEVDKWEWFKLGLFYDQFENSGLARNYPIKAPETDEHSEKMVVDYLTSLRKYIETYLENRLSVAFSRSTPKEWIITVPAILSDKLKAKTLNSAKKAGMGPVRLIAEPEAAALYALESMPSTYLHIGDTFVVCDAGGG
jgi:hypothetical protein